MEHRVFEVQATAAERHLPLQVVEQVNEKARAMMAFQNAQFAAACLLKMGQNGGRCEGCGQ